MWVLVGRRVCGIRVGKMLGVRAGRRVGLCVGDEYGVSLLRDTHGVIACGGVLPLAPHVTRPL